MEKRMRLEIEITYDPEFLCEEHEREEVERLIIKGDFALDDIGEWTVKRIISWGEGEEENAD